MNHVYVSLKYFRVKNIFKLLSDTQLFLDIPFNQSKYIDYHFDHNLDTDTWFQIKEFSKQDYCPDYLKEIFEPKSIEDNKEKFEKISTIISYQDGSYYFQEVRNKAFIKRKILTFGDKAEILNKEDVLIINELPDAIYFKDKDVMIFKDFTVTARIFKGMSELYFEATNTEVESFLNNSFIKLDNLVSHQVSKPNRKRINGALQRLNGLSQSEVDSYINYIKPYCGNHLIFDETTKQFKLSTDNDLKILLYGLDERFYETPITKIKKVANSVYDI